MTREHKAAGATALFLTLLGMGSVLSALGPAGPTKPTVPPVARALIVPVEGVVVGDLVDSWGAARSGGRRHEGVDIVAPAGTAVRASASGTVAKLFKSKLGGTTFYQYDEQGALILYYAHLEAYAPGLKAGMRIAQGQVIGYVGATGNATTPHLHFEVHRAGPDRAWWRGRAVNPYLALKAGGVDDAPVTAAAASR